MSKYALIPTSRLICFGSARSLTNSPDGGIVLEDELGNKFNP